MCYCTPRKKHIVERAEPAPSAVAASAHVRRRCRIESMTARRCRGKRPTVACLLHTREVRQVKSGIGRGGKRRAACRSMTSFASALVACRARSNSSGVRCRAPRTSSTRTGVPASRRRPALFAARYQLRCRRCCSAARDVAALEGHRRTAPRVRGRVDSTEGPVGGGSAWAAPHCWRGLPPATIATSRASVDASPRGGTSRWFMHAANDSRWGLPRSKPCTGATRAGAWSPCIYLLAPISLVHTESHRLPPMGLYEPDEGRSGRKETVRPALIFKGLARAAGRRLSGLHGRCHQRAAHRSQRRRSCRLARPGAWPRGRSRPRGARTQHDGVAFADGFSAFLPPACGPAADGPFFTGRRRGSARMTPGDVDLLVPLCAILRQMRGAARGHLRDPRRGPARTRCPRALGLRVVGAIKRGPGRLFVYTNEYLRHDGALKWRRSSNHWSCSTVRPSTQIIFAAGLAARSESMATAADAEVADCRVP